MTYLLLTACFLLIAVLFALAAGLGIRGVGAAALGIAALCLLVLTAVFDTIMIAAGLFTYADALILGPRIGLAPVEDFAYPLAAVILLPALWMRLRRRDDR
ncbi:lycopene cyclase domain-containing protein [Microbacterium natoriense]